MLQPSDHEGQVLSQPPGLFISIDSFSLTHCSVNSYSVFNCQPKCPFPWSHYWALSKAGFLCNDVTTSYLCFFFFPALSTIVLNNFRNRFSKQLSFLSPFSSSAVGSIKARSGSVFFKCLSQGRCMRGFYNIADQQSRQVRRTWGTSLCVLIQIQWKVLQSDR